MNASFLLNRLAQRIVFFYAPKVLGGKKARPAVAGDGATGWQKNLTLREVEWRRVGADLMLNALL